MTTNRITGLQELLDCRLGNLALFSTWHQPVTQSKPALGQQST